MVMISSEEEREVSQQEAESSSVSRTRHAASVLANKKRGRSKIYKKRDFLKDFILFLMCMRSSSSLARADLLLEWGGADIHIFV